MTPAIRNTILWIVGVMVLGAPSVQAQTASYHLHKDLSGTNGVWLQLKPNNPDDPSTAVQSIDWRNFSTGIYVVKRFDTQSGVPNASGNILSGTTVSMTLWMRKTANAGVMRPYARVQLNDNSGPQLCAATGASNLTTTLTSYSLSCTTTSTVAMTTSDHYFLYVGAEITTAPGDNTVMGEVDVEGTLNGSSDSRITVPLPVPPPTITNITPGSGAVGQSVTISGTNFSLGPLAVSFNGTAASPGMGNATSFATTVPAGATTGPVVVTVNGIASNGYTFTVLNPTITSLTPNTGPVGQAVTIAGANFGATQGSSTVKFNGTTATPTSWSATSISVPVPTGATTGSVVVTVNGVASNGSTFIVPGPVFYSYDGLGRLTQVSSPSSESAFYRYDAVGNIVGIDRTGAGVVGISGFAPSKGIVGTTVTISGSGFSGTAAQNTVKFNGTTASIVSANATQLVVTVPASATTGSISMTAPGGAATSASSFTVLTTNGVPTITGFTPTTAAEGVAITITGTNFDTVVANNAVVFNTTRQAAPTSATSTTIVAAVPHAMGGHLSVGTVAGTATSTADLFIPPAPYVAGDVVATSRTTVGTATNVTVGTASKVGLVLFDGTAGQRASVNITSSTITETVASVYRPDALQLSSSGQFGATGFIDAQTLPWTGTYTILIDPNSTYTGSLTLTAYSFLDVTGSITANGTAAAISLPTPGKNARLTFSGTSGQVVSGLATIGTFSGSCVNPSLRLSILKPDGSSLSSIDNVCGAGPFIEPITLPTTGVYTVLVDPQSNNTGDTTAYLYTINDVTGSITINGAGVPVSLPTPGQRALLTFSGTNGQVVSVSATIGTFSGSCVNPALQLVLVKPDGTALGTASSCISGPSLTSMTLPVTGTYTVRLDPQGTNTGSSTITLTSP